MKNYKLGNDYAFQRNQSKQPEPAPAIEQPATSEVNPETNVGDQIQNAPGEGNVGENTETQTIRAKAKKKKETGAESEQPQEEPPIQ